MEGPGASRIWNRLRGRLPWHLFTPRARQSFSCLLGAGHPPHGNTRAGGARRSLLRDRALGRQFGEGLRMGFTLDGLWERGAGPLMGSDSCTGEGAVMDRGAAAPFLSRGETRFGSG